MAGKVIFPNKPDVDLRGKKVLQLADGEAQDDAVNKKQLDAVDTKTETNKTAIESNDTDIATNAQNLTNHEDATNPHGVTEGFGIVAGSNYSPAGSRVTITADNTGDLNTTTVASIEYVEQGLTTKVDDSQLKQTITNDQNDVASTAALTTEFGTKQDQITVSEDGETLTIPDGSGGTTSFTGGGGVTLANTSSTPGQVIYDGTRYYLETNGGAFGRWSPYAQYAVGARALLDQVLYECIEPVAESTDGSNMNPSTDIFLSTQRPGSTQAGQTSTTHWKYIAGPIQEFNAGDNYLKGSEIEYEHLGNKQTYVTLFSLNSTDTTGTENTPERHSYRLPAELNPSFTGDTNVWYEHALGGFDGVGDHQSFDFPSTYPGAGFFIPVGSVWHHNGQEWRFEGPNQAQSSHPIGTLYDVDLDTFNGNSGNIDPLTGVAAKHFPPNKYSGLWSETFGDNQWGPFNIYQPGQVVTFNVGTIAEPDWKEYIRTGAATTFAGAANPNALFTPQGVLTAGWTENGPLFHTVDWENLPDDVTDFKIDDLVYFESSLFKAKVTHTKEGTHPNPDEDPTRWDIVYGGLSSIDTLEALGDLTTANSNVLIGQQFLVMNDGANNGIYVVTEQNSTGTTSTLEILIGQGTGGGVDVEETFPTDAALGHQILLDPAGNAVTVVDSNGHRRPRGFYSYIQPLSNPNSRYWEQVTIPEVPELYNNAREGDLIYLTDAEEDFNTGGNNFTAGFYRAGPTSANAQTWISTDGSTGDTSVKVNDTDVANPNFETDTATTPTGFEYSPPFQNNSGKVSVQVDTREIANALGINSLKEQVHQIEEELSHPGGYTWVDETIFDTVFVTNRVNSSGTTNQATILQPHFTDNSNIFTTYALLTGTDSTGLRNQWNGFNSNAAGIIVGLGPDDTDLVAFQLLSTYYRDSIAAGLAEIRLKMIDPDGTFAGPSQSGSNTNKQQFLSWISDNDNPITTEDPNPVIHQGIATYYYETDNDFLDTVRHSVGSHIEGSALTPDERVIVDSLENIVKNSADGTFIGVNSNAISTVNPQQTFFTTVDADPLVLFGVGGALVARIDEVSAGDLLIVSTGGAGGYTNVYVRNTTGTADSNAGWTGPTSLTTQEGLGALANVTFSDQGQNVEIKAPANHGLIIEGNPSPGEPNDDARSVVIEQVVFNETAISNVVSINGRAYNEDELFYVQVKESGTFQAPPTLATAITGQAVTIMEQQ